jgi:N-acetylglucosamine-6-phosphate deacetylase
MHGFVDLQVNGYRGVSFSSRELTKESLRASCCAILADGACAAICPTVITSSAAIYAHVLPLLADLCDAGGLGGRILGIHLEGPFISPEPGAVGCHPAVHCVAPSVKRFDALQALARGHVKLVTIAAEIEGAPSFCRSLVERGVAVSLGHMLADAAQVRALADAGATLLTHLGNGLPNMVHRHETSLWASLAEDRLSAMVISDGQHLRAETLTAFVRAKSLARIIVTSDAAPVAGLPDGEYDCFGARVRVEGEAVRSATEPCLAGSGSLMLRCVNHLASIALIDTGGDREGGGADGAAAVGGGPRRMTRGELERVAFFNPLRALGIDAARLQHEWGARPALVRWCAAEGGGGRFERTRE